VLDRIGWERIASLGRDRLARHVGRTDSFQRCKPAPRFKPHRSEFVGRPCKHAIGQPRSPRTRRSGLLSTVGRNRRLIERSFAARRRSAAPRRARLEMLTRHKPFRSVRPACQCLSLSERARRHANREGWGWRGVALGQQSRSLMRFCGSPQLEARNRKVCYLRVGDPPRAVAVFDLESATGTVKSAHRSFRRNSRMTALDLARTRAPGLLDQMGQQPISFYELVEQNPLQASMIFRRFSNRSPRR